LTPFRPVPNAPPLIEFWANAWSTFFPDSLWPYAKRNIPPRLGFLQTISDTYRHLENVFPAIQQAGNVFDPTTQKIAVNEFHGDLPG
jgi:hypothetical protein